MTKSTTNSSFHDRHESLLEKVVVICLPLAAVDLLGNRLDEAKPQRPRKEKVVQYEPLKTDWCGREDSNFHGLSATATSTLRVYQFRHDRTIRCPKPQLQPIGGGG
jgi:hypothetical protein